MLRTADRTLYVAFQGGAVLLPLPLFAAAVNLTLERRGGDGAVSVKRHCIAHLLQWYPYVEGTGASWRCRSIDGGDASTGRSAAERVPSLRPLGASNQPSLSHRPWLDRQMKAGARSEWVRVTRAQMDIALDMRERHGHVLQ